MLAATAIRAVAVFMCKSLYIINNIKRGAHMKIENLTPSYVNSIYEDRDCTSFRSLSLWLTDTMKDLFRVEAYGELASLADEVHAAFVFAMNQEECENSIGYQVGYIAGVSAAVEELLCSTHVRVRELIAKHKKNLSANSLELKVAQCLIDSSVGGIQLSHLLDHMSEYDEHNVRAALQHLVDWDMALVYRIGSTMFAQMSFIGSECVKYLANQ